jgi:hypothetical protein
VCVGVHHDSINKNTQNPTTTFLLAETSVRMALQHNNEKQVSDHGKVWKLLRAACLLGSREPPSSLFLVQIRIRKQQAARGLRKQQAARGLLVTAQN